MFDDEDENAGATMYHMERLNGTTVVDVCVGDDVYVLCHFFCVTEDMKSISLSDMNAGYAILREPVASVSPDGNLVIARRTDHSGIFSTFASARDGHVSQLQARVDEAKTILAKAELELCAAGEIKLLNRG